MSSKLLRTISIAAAVGLFATACSDDDDAVSTATTEAPTPADDMADDMDADALGTIVDVAVADGRFTTLVAAVQAADLVDTLSGEGPFTVFAPLDDAFAALPEGTVEGLLEDPAALAGILTYHVVGGAVDAATVVGLDGESVETVNGDSLVVGVTDDGVTLTDSSGNTVNVVVTDVPADNGVIHVIDGVLLPAADDMADDMDADALGTIVDVAVADGRFTTLVAAVQAADLVDTLSGEGPFTVFAPLDDAFAALPEGTVEGLLEDPAALAGILTYHVVGGAVDAATVVGLDGESVETVNGDSLVVGVTDDGVTLTDSSGNTVNVVVTDVPADNGVIHVIDAVLLPAA